MVYQYFVGVSSRRPFWQLNIPRGSVIQLVPHLFGFEERRFSFRQSPGRDPGPGPGHEAPAAGQPPPSFHMVSHWEQ